MKTKDMKNRQAAADAELAKECMTPFQPVEQRASVSTSAVEVVVRCYEFAITWCVAKQAHADNTVDKQNKGHRSSHSQGPGDSTSTRQQL